MKFTKIPSKEALGLVWDARKFVSKNLHIRFGQALWNSLPTELVSSLTGTELDFFYCQSDIEVEKTFFNHYVDWSEVS